MDKSTRFTYNYSAQKNKEVLEIRNRYLPKEESKLEKLKKLDRKVQLSGTIEGLIIGILSFLLFGLGVCLAIKVIGSSVLAGAVFGIIGAVGMILAYPICHHSHCKTKKRLTPEILELANELTGEKVNKNV